MLGLKAPLQALLASAQAAPTAATPRPPNPPQFPPPATTILFLFMIGGPRHVDAGADRMDPGAAGIGDHDAGGAEDRKPADDAEALLSRPGLRTPFLRIAAEGRGGRAAGPSGHG